MESVRFHEPDRDRRSPRVVTTEPGWHPHGEVPSRLRLGIAWGASVLAWLFLFALVFEVAVGIGATIDAQETYAAARAATRL